jgi:hypothetical protein
MTSVIPFETSAEADSDGSGSDQQVGRQRSRHRRWRALASASQTVIQNIEDPRCYRAFERSIVGSFGPRTVIELELVHRLASLLWRLRRASAIETGLLGMQGGNRPLNSTRTGDAHTGSRKPSDVARFLVSRSPNCGAIAQCFLRLSRLDPALLDRVGAYEMRLWRQAAQTIWILDAIRRPSPPPARRPFRKAVPHHFWDRER